MSVNRNIFYTFLTQIPTLILGIVAGIFITRILGAAGKGVYATFQSDIELFTLVLSFSISGGIVYFVSSQKIELNKLLGIGISLVLSGLILLSIILFAAKMFFEKSFIFPDFYDSWFYVLYIIITFTLSISNALLAALFQGKSLFKVVNTVTIVNSVLNIVFFSLAFLYHLYIQIIGVKEVFILTMLVLALNSILWLWFYKKNIGTRPSFKVGFVNDIKPLLKFVLFNHIGHVVNLLNYRLDIWVINHYADDIKEVGYYNLAVSTAQMLWLISTPIASVLAPFLTSSLNEGKNQAFEFFSKFNFTVCFLILSLAVVFAPIVLPLFYGAEFVNSVLPFLILSVGVLFFSISKIFAVYIYSVGKVKYNLIASIVGLFFTVVLDFALIPQIGIIGASIASSVSYMTIFLTTSLFLFGKIKLPFQNYYFLNRKDLRLLIDRSTKLLESIRRV